MSTATQPTETASETRAIPLSQLILITDPSHPLYDKRAKEKPSPELVNDMRERGQLQNIVVVPDGNGSYMVAAGRRRTQAAEILEWPTLDAKVVELDSAVQMKEVMISENENRKGDNLVRKAMKLKSYWEELEKEHLEGHEEGVEVTPLSDKVKVDRACAIFGVKFKQIENLTLLAYNASPKVLGAVEKDKINGTTAVEIVRRFPDSHEKQEKLLIKLLTGKSKPTSKGVDPLGERPVKAKELLELRDSAYIPKTTKVAVKDFATFSQGR